MSAFNNTIQWYENKELDVSTLRSPTPCPRGVFCQYKIPNPETKELEIACCRMVHPGEEGNGRRLFPARTTPDGRQQPACVRLTGNAGFYERCRLKQPWRTFAEERNIPLPPTDVPWVQVERVGFQKKNGVQHKPVRKAAVHSDEQIYTEPSNMVAWPSLPNMVTATPFLPPSLDFSGLRRESINVGFSHYTDMLPPICVPGMPATASTIEELLALEKQLAAGMKEENRPCIVMVERCTADDSLNAEGAMEAVD